MASESYDRLTDEEVERIEADQLGELLIDQTGIETYNFAGEYLRLDLDATEVVFNEFERAREVIQSVAD